MRIRLLTGLGPFCLACVVSCGSREASEVLGEVSLLGTPLDHGSIVFVPLQAADAAVTGGEISGGHYRITKQLRPGDYRVEIRSPRPSSKPIRIRPGYPGPPPLGHEEGIDAAFNDSSGLTATVARGINRLDFRVEPRADGPAPVSR
jgi:hypothetical protein